MVRTAALVLALIPAPAMAAAPLTPAEKAAVSQSLSGILLDAESARWRWLSPTEGNVILYCGFVNAKNSYGAYSGFRPFMVSLVRRTKTALAATIGNPGSDDEEITIRMCASKGYDLSEVPTG